MRALISIAALSLYFLFGGAPQPDFSGHWKQQTESKTQRQLEIDQVGQDLQVKTTVIGADGTKNLRVKYVIGGPEVAYKGLDGDEFHSKVHWDNSTLVFDILEHEDGKNIRQQALWTLSADRNTLQVERVSTKSAGPTHSVTKYIREP